MPEQWGVAEKTMEYLSISPTLAIESSDHNDPLRAYERYFGALPNWFDEISASAARSLARQSVRRGAPLSPADVVEH